MKKRVFCLLMAALLLGTAAYAARRAVTASPSLRFDGTTAICAMEILADKATDRISATMELYQGRTLIDRWAASDTGVLYMEESTDVEMNKTYTLTVRYTINGADQSPCSVSKTNR